MRGLVARRAVSSASAAAVVRICCKRRRSMICTIGRAHYARPAPVPKVMTELIRLYTQIALLRRGPQDLPASTLLLVLTVVGYLIVNVVVSTVLPPIKAWPGPLLVDTLFTLLWYVVLLRLA